MSQGVGFFRIGAAVLAVLTAGSGLFVLTGVPVVAGWRLFFDAGFGSLSRVVGLVGLAAPLALCGLAFAAPLRAGLVNLGGEGQIAAAGVAAWFVGQALLPTGTALGLAGMLVASLAAGGTTAAIAALFRNHRGVDPLLTTMFLNVLLAVLLEHVVFGPQRDPGLMGFPGTAGLPISTPLVPGPLAFFLAALAGVGLGRVLERTGFGLGLRALSDGEAVVRGAGFSPARLRLWALCLGGSLAGAAGALDLVNGSGRLEPGFLHGAGFEGVLVGALCGPKLAWAAPAALIPALCEVGGEALQREYGLASASTSALEALLVLALPSGVLFGKRTGGVGP